MRQTVNSRTTAIVDPRSAIQTHLTQAMLAAQEGISEASVWFDNDEMVAHVTVLEGSEWSPLDLQRLCAEQLGLHQTPRRIYLVATRPTFDSIRFAA
jgi:hypothetical protein